MRKQKFLIAAIVLIIALAIVIYMVSKSPTGAGSEAKVLENKFFLSQEPFYPPITFAYPVFKDWNVKVGENSIEYSPSESLNLNLYQPLRVIVREVEVKSSEAIPETRKNQYDCEYFEKGTNPSGNEVIVFYVKDYTLSGERFETPRRKGYSAIEVEIPKNFSSFGFSGKILYDTIVNSFTPIYAPA